MNMGKFGTRGRLSFLTLVLFMVGCANAPPQQSSNICLIFQQYPSWYEGAYDSEKKWGVPISVSMAIMKQESGFRHDAKPPRDYVLGFIPWGRVSSAYGYPQALDSTWDDYENATSGWKSRTNFDDSIDFIAWYVDGSSRDLGLSKNNTYAHYLAYHEGRAGYRRQTYANKSWLTSVARKVDNTSKSYASQLPQCLAKLEEKRKSWW